jgi:hypothetical protein
MKDNQAPAQYINAIRKEEAWRKEGEARKKTEEEAWKKVMVVARRFDEGQSSKDVRTWRKLSFKGWSKACPTSC